MVEVCQHVALGKAYLWTECNGTHSKQHMETFKRLNYENLKIITIQKVLFKHECVTITVPISYIAVIYLFSCIHWKEENFSDIHNSVNFLFLKLLYCCSIAVACIFLPLLPPTPTNPTSFPCFPPPPWFCPRVLYSSSWKRSPPLLPLLPLWLLLDCS